MPSHHEHWSVLRGKQNVRMALPDRKELIFIAFDKQAAYTADTQAILERNCVLRLSDGNCELYGRPWNKEEQN